MLLIKWHNEDERAVACEWHTNEPVPPVEGPVVTFQADGDELNYLLACMRKILYDKPTGCLFTARTEEL
jgi:hypothetical protein